MGAEDSPLLFVSHAGVDADAAEALVERIEKAPSAKEQGLRAWFDKRDLRPGQDWQEQIEAALARSTAFAVYVGATGIVNWVDREVRVALDRAGKDKAYPSTFSLARTTPRGVLRVDPHSDCIKGAEPHVAPTPQN